MSEASEKAPNPMTAVLFTLAAVSVAVVVLFVAVAYSPGRSPAPQRSEALRTAMDLPAIQALQWVADEEGRVGSKDGAPPLVREAALAARHWKSMGLAVTSFLLFLFGEHLWRRGWKMGEAVGPPGVALKDPGRIAQARASTVMCLVGFALTIAAILFAIGCVAYAIPASSSPRIMTIEFIREGVL